MKMHYEDLTLSNICSYEDAIYAERSLQLADKTTDRLVN